MNEYLKAAIRLHTYLVDRHWNGQALIGPDPIGRINWRVTRFIKGYVAWLPWGDDFAYIQGQAYWIKANLALFKLTGETGYRDLAGQCADYVMAAQLPSGAWEHPPLRERRGFISSVESLWGALGLMAAYESLGKTDYVSAAQKAYEALVNMIGFSRLDDGLSINYYAHSKQLIPNINTIFLWLMAQLYRASGQAHYLDYSGPVLRFLARSQKDSGEFEYVYGDEPHFQCYQYNAFQFLSLAGYYALVKDEAARGILARLASFVSSGLGQRDQCRYDCFKENPETNYWTAALAAATYQANGLGIGDYADLSQRAYRRVLGRQNANGGFDFSDRNYVVLSDKRSYPRQQAMILDCLLLRAKEDN